MDASRSDRLTTSMMQSVWLSGYMRKQFKKTEAAIDHGVRAVKYVSGDARYPGLYVSMEK